MLPAASKPNAGSASELTHKIGRFGRFTRRSMHETHLGRTSNPPGIMPASFELFIAVVCVGRIARGDNAGDSRLIAAAQFPELIEDFVRSAPASNSKRTLRASGIKPPFGIDGFSGGRKPNCTSHGQRKSCGSKSG